MRPEVLAKLAFNRPSGLLDVYSKCGIFFVRLDGLAMPTPMFDNGADAFCHGLARYLHDGKYGYMNAKLEVVVAPTYDFAFPFAGNYGVVCQDCVTSSDGEHTSISCTRCGAVDAQGTLVAPLELPSSEVFKRYDGPCVP